MGSKNKKSGKNMFGLGLGGVLVVGLILAFVFGWIQLGDGAPQAGINIGGSGGGASCDVASVTYTYNDVDRFARATDPDGAHVWVVEKEQSYTEAAGLSGLTPQKTHTYLAGENSSTVFSESGSFMTECFNEDVIVEVVQAGAPTISFINDDGVTANSDANHEPVDADSKYSPTVKIKAPADKCSSRHGALLVAEYDLTTVQDVDVKGLTAVSTTPNFITHNSSGVIGGGNYAFDQFKAYRYSGELCDGETVEYQFTLETASTGAGEDNDNVHFWWLPMDYDLNADDNSIIGPAIQDEDNNNITLGSAGETFYTA